MCPLLRRCLALFSLLVVASAAQPAAESSVVVLNNGETLTGQVTQQGDRLQLTMPGGEIWLRTTDVERVCPSLEAAYWEKRAALKEPLGASRLALAEWCLRHGLVEFAAQEIDEASDARPRDLFRMQQWLRQVQEQHNDVKPASAAQDLPATLAELDRVVQSVPARSVEEFSTSIQPLLINSCSTTACHGPQAGRSFTLLRQPLGPRSRRVSQRNLQAALSLVDRQKPLESRLLAVPLEAHGGAQTPLFRGANDDRYRRLVAWVQGVGPAMETPAQQVAQPAAAAARTFNEPSAVSTSAGPPAQLPQPAAEGAHELHPQQSAPQAFTPQDPFDPEIFNRQYAQPAPQESAAPHESGAILRFGP